MLTMTKKQSQTEKLGYGVWATYRKVGSHEEGGTCPPTCKHLKEKTCYAMYGHVNFAAKRSDQNESDAAELLEWLRKIPKFGMVRHHVSGDLMGKDGKVDREYIKAMVQGHEESKVRGWGYTHAWRDLEPSECNTNRLAINASCDSYQEAREAVAAGWPTVMVVRHDDLNPGPLVMDDGEVIPVVVCLEQSSKVPCSVCKKCARGTRREIVAFLGHGTKKKHIGMEAT